MAPSSPAHTAQLHLETALIEDHATSAKLGKAVWLKMECFQPIGSFKIRGIGLLCQRNVQAGKTHLVSSSGGNAGLAVAYSARKLAVRATVIVPSTTPPATRALLTQYGAEVVVHGEVWDEADTVARELSAQPDAAYISPFDHPSIWEGHGSLISEVAASGCRPDTVVVAVGGGGLFCGVIDGLRRNGWHDVQVIAAETLGADSFHQSIEAGCLITLPAVTSIAKSLGARRVSSEALKMTREQSVHSVVVSDAAALEAAVTFLREQRVLVEPACGAALSVVYRNHAALRNAKTILVVVCGGISVSDVIDAFWRTSHGAGAT